ncbi:MAG TPA: hypothetical protein VGP88_02885, partial [Thermoplasmata archaeon]|nr:hypothetical protein [Thermoplasmata archaeon]
MTSSASGPATRTQTSQRRLRLLSVPAMAFVALTAVLLLAAPFAESAPVVTLTAPFSGTPFQTIAHYHQGCGFNLVAHDLLFSAAS